MTPWCDDLVCSWRRLLADRHSLPFPWTLSLHRRWCPSASHHPLTFLFLPALTFPLPSPFPSLGLFLRPGGGGAEGWHDAWLCCCLQLAAPIGLSPPCALPLPAWPVRTSLLAFLSLGRLCLQSPWTVPVSLLRVGSTRRRATALAVGQVRPSGHPHTGGGGPLPDGGFWAPGPGGGGEGG